jgi:hypothetical protein
MTSCVRSHLRRLAHRFEALVGAARWALSICALTVLGVLCVGVAGAGAEVSRAGWELSATTYPSNLVDGVDQVTQVVASEEAGSFKLGYEEAQTAAIPFGSAAGVVQADLEALTSVGAGNVQVVASGVAGGYTVTFVGALGDRKGSELEAQGASASVSRQGAASGTIGINVFNVGAAGSEGTITVTDTLPPGIKAKEAGELGVSGQGEFRASSEGWGVDPTIGHKYWNCTGNGPGAAAGVAGATTVTCVNGGFSVFQGGGGLPISEGANPQPPVGIAVESGVDAPALTNRVSITGGGAATAASTQNSITVGPVPAHQGLTGWDAWFSNSDGTIDTQAGSHPYEMTSVFNLATETSPNRLREGFIADGEPRDLEAQLPPGFVGNLASVPQCTEQQLDLEESGSCPVASMVGLIKAQTVGGGVETIHPIFNMVPPPGEPAQLAAKILRVTLRVDFSVRTGGDDGLTAHINNLPQSLIDQGMLTIWGVPGDHSHDRWRSGHNGGCSQEQLEHSQVGESQETYCTAPQFPLRTPVLTLPTACGEPQPFTIRELRGWQDPGAKSEISVLSHDANDQPIGFSGCENLAFGPSITATPDTGRADSLSGLSVLLTPTLGGLDETTSLGSADVEGASVTLPPGLVVNPGQAAGLQSCSLTQAALEANPGGGENDGPAACPAASKLGTVLIRSPLLEGAGEKQFEGNVYLLPSNPPDLKLLVAASADGVNLKLVGTAHLDEATGQVTASFQGTPQLPASLFRLTFEGGPHAALVTPAACGTYSVAARLSSWASPALPDFVTGASFGVVEGAGGGACPQGALPFAPSFTAGSSSTEAGSYTGVSVLLARGDGQQRVERLQVTLPKGMAAAISSVPLCEEPQAAQGTCPVGSQIGHALVDSGPGSDPLVLPQPGGPELPVYLTGAYDGSPFGLSIVTPVVAGPFDLGTIVTRARIAVDPHTAQVTVTTDPLPQIVKGVPTDIREVYADIDRPGFSFNPTNCGAEGFIGTAWGTPPAGAGGAGSSVGVSSRFEAGGCQGLKFAPKLTASTRARTSKASGASLTVKLTPPAQGPAPVSGPGSGVEREANLRRVKVDLPKQLPSQLKTLQKACTSVQFDANPAGCPKESLVGTARARTPILPVALTGPAYFVSHGNEAFPQLVLVLQGEGVTVDLAGNTFISKAGITSSTFASVPDVPVSSFELTLPQGKYSALTANLPASAHGSFCGQKLALPTELVGQNGAVIHDSTPVSVSGCPKAKKIMTKAQKLTAALKACKKNGKGKRATCETAARKRYAPARRKAAKKI